MTTVNIATWGTRHSIVDWDCFKTQPLQEILKIRNRHLEAFYENLVLARSCHQFDVQEANFSITQFCRILVHCNRCVKVMQTPTSTAHGEPERDQILNPKFNQIKTFFSWWISLEHFWGQRSVDQDIQKRKQYYRETCFKDTPSGVRLVVRLHQFRSQDPNQMCLTPKTKWQTGTRDEWNHFLHLFNIMIFDSLAQPFLCSKQEAKRCHVDKIPRRSFGRFTDRPRALNLKSHRHLSIARQNSQNTNDSEFPESGRTDTILHGYRKPLQESTESLSWLSQERTQGITSKIGSKHSDENVSSHSIGTPMQGTWNQESSKSSRQEYECSHSIGKPMRGTHTRKENQTRTS